MKAVVILPETERELLLALPAVKQLLAVIGPSQVVLACLPPLMPLLRELRWEVESISPEAIHGHFDLGIELSERAENAALLWRKRVKRRIGFASLGSELFLNEIWPVDPKSSHLFSRSELYWQVLRLVHPSLQTKGLETYLDIEDFSDSGSQPAAQGILLCPDDSLREIDWRLLAAELASLGSLRVLFSQSSWRSGFSHFKNHFSAFNQLRVDSAKEALRTLAPLEAVVGMNNHLTHCFAISARYLALIAPGGLSPVEAPFHPLLRICSPKDLETASDIALLLKDGRQPSRRPVSAFVICKNEEANIVRCLKSLQWCDEVLVVDSGSTDSTLQRCESLATRIISRDWPGHRLQKQFALGECQHDWVLNIDADEELSPELRRQILDILERDEQSQLSESGFELCRVVRFLQQWWYRGGWHPEYRLRLMRKSFASWGGIDPHEKALVRGKTGRLNGFLYHYSFSNLSHHVNTTNRFTSLMVEMLAQRGTKFRLIKLVVNPIARFLKFFVLKRGYRFGIRGFIVAVGEAYQCFLKHAKLWESEQSESTTDLELRDAADPKVVELSEDERFRRIRKVNNP